MKTDAQLKQDVSAELTWDPSINAGGVGVAVRDGVVTLSGHLDNYAEKQAVERAVQRVSGVKAVVLELEVKLDPGHRRSDTEITTAAELMFRWHALIPGEQLRVKADKGWVTLTGEVDWDHQRHGAEQIVRTLTGVLGVTNAIALRSQVSPAHIGQRIREALTRQAEHEASKIEVKVSGTTVTLHGTVHSWAEVTAATRAAWSAPGISFVVNELEVTDRA